MHHRLPTDFLRSGIPSFPRSMLLAPEYRITLDSRLVEPGDIFWPLTGARYDGHDFIDESIARGAVAVISHRPPRSGICVIPVSDTLVAYHRLAALWMRRFQDRGGISIAISGSAGKTSVKEIMATLCAGPGTYASHDNQNNAFGLPRSILNMPDDARLAILEIGVGGPGEMAGYTDMVQPTHAILTNVFPAHIECFRDMEQLALEKCLLFARLSRDGRAVYGGSHRYAHYIQQVSLGAYCPMAPESSYWKTSDGTEILTTGAITDCNGRAYSFPLTGHYQRQNAAMALEAGLASGIDTTTMLRRTHMLRALPMRYERFEGRITMILDCYNANIGSAAAGLLAFSSETTSGKRYVVLGTMAEQGTMAPAQHYKLGQLTGEMSGIHGGIVAGEYRDEVVRGYHAASGGSLLHCVSHVDEIPGILHRLLQDGDIVWVKASRFMGLEHTMAAWHQSLKNV